MDKIEAIELLKQALTEIPHLQELHYDNQEFILWRSKLLNVIKAKLDSDDFNNYTGAWNTSILRNSTQQEYKNNLVKFNTTIKSIIQKYEILGIEGEGNTEGEVEKMDNQMLEKTKEIEIQGDSLEKLYPIIKMVESELRFRNFFYEVRLANSNVTESYAGFAVFAIEPASVIKTLVGAFTLLLLGSNRITLRVSPRSRWHHDFDLTPSEITKLGFIEKDENTNNSYDEVFNQFVKSLEDRLTHYSLRITLPKRLWHWVKTNILWSLIIVGIPVIAALIYVIDYFYNLFD